MSGFTLRAVPACLVAFGVVLALMGARCGTEDGDVREPDMRLGYETYMANCAACHGDDGGGDGPLAEPLAVELGVAPLRLDAASGASDLGRAELREVIALGGARTDRSNLMPGWQEELEPEALEAVTDFVMAMALGRPIVPDETMREYVDAPAGMAADGRKLYVYYCSACHGPRGKGDGRVSPTLSGDVRPRDLTDTSYMQEKSDQDLYAAIALGGRHAGLSSAMPGWTYELTPEQIRSLISYLRTLSGTPHAD